MNKRGPGTLRLACKLLTRDWRAGELTVLVSALLVAVAAMTGVAFLTDRTGFWGGVKTTPQRGSCVQGAVGECLRSAFAGVE